MSKLDKVVLIGRQQGPHLAHIEMISRAATLGKGVIILLGSSFKARDSRNPFKWVERAEMIRQSLPEDLLSRIQFRPIRDHLYNDNAWASGVQNAVRECLSSPDETVGIIGHVKDETSYYLNMFPQWDRIHFDNIDGYDSTYIRNEFFANGLEYWKDVGRSNVKPITTPAVIKFLDYFTTLPEYEYLVAWTQYVHNYKRAWAGAPHPVIFQTADAVVTCAGHILMVERKAHPGKGLWALPGGFVNPFEKVEDACFRELGEESKIKVPEKVLRGCLDKENPEKRFDHPLRSTRGRTITNAFNIKLPPGPLPKVKGSDDAKKARWIPLSEFAKMEELCFEDHFHIVQYFTGMAA